MSPSKLIRRSHLLLALFLTPWILMYAVSTITMHHRALFAGAAERAEPEYELVREMSYGGPLATDRAAAAVEILSEVGMLGAHSVQGSLEEGPLTVNRHRPIRPVRITYDSGRLRIERQVLSITHVLERLHRRRGYDQPFLSTDAWAVIVDGVIAAILLWAATGLWMWWELARTRTSGAVCLLLGAACFLFFLLVL